MITEEKGKFKILKVTELSKLASLEVKELPESDLTIQTNKEIIQLEFSDSEKEKKKFLIKPGCFTIEETGFGTRLSKFDLRTYDLLESIDNTSAILNEGSKFFNKLDVYKALNRNPKRSLLMCSPPGVGKCLHPDEEVIMYDGIKRKSKEITVGDQLMGPDSKPRNVLAVSEGEDEMYKIVPTKGEPYIVNSEHILSLVSTDTNKITNISVKKWLKSTSNFKERNKSYKSEEILFDCDGIELPIDPYILGLWLGDGHSNTSALTSMDQELIKNWCDYGESLGLQVRKEFLDNNRSDIYHITTGIKYGSKGKNYFQSFLRKLNLKNNKHVPHIYKTHTIKNRLKILAGLIDTDGHLSNNCYEIIQKRENLIDDIAYICHSVGLAAYKTQKLVKEKIYYRLIISGNIDKIPVKLTRKLGQPRKQIKNALRTGINIEPLGRGKYNGFVLDSDHLFLLKDFTVTHNTASINTVCRALLKEEGTCVAVWDTADIRASVVNRFFLYSSNFSKKVKRFIFIIEDINGGTTEDEHGGKGVNTSLLNLLDGVGDPFKNMPTLILATTNNPERTVGALIDRPGRFDKVIELKTPNEKECIELLSFISKKELVEEEREAAKLAAKNDFSIAHLQEVVVRSLIDDITMLQACNQLVTHKKRFKEAFQETKSLGIGIRQ